ncbi:MAG: hypothetical protein HUU55_05235 [Myxococcales bacterium]|nr:hypothetical protein [Myxococcales bacterium]
MKLFERPTSSGRIGFAAGSNRVCGWVQIARWVAVCISATCIVGWVGSIILGQSVPLIRNAFADVDPDTLLIVDDANNSISGPAPFVGSFWFRGKLTSEFAVDTEFAGEPESVFRSNQRLWLSAEAELAEDLKAQVSGRLSWQTWISQETNARYTLYPELRDSWLSWSGVPWLPISVGYQTWSFGASDFFAPTDQINPRDYRDGIGASLETTKVPVLGVNVDFLPLAPTFRLSVAWIPFFEPDRVFLFGDDFGLFGPGTSPPPSAAFSGMSELSQRLSPVLVEALQPIFLGTDKSDESPGASTVGVKMSSTLGDVDISLHYLFGWDRTPVFRVDPALTTLFAVMSPGATLTPEVIGLFTDIQSGKLNPFGLFSSSYERLHLVGADVTFPIWEFGLRLEAAYQPSKVLYTREFTSISRPTLVGIMGIDYSWGTTFMASVELSYRRIFDFPAKTSIYLGEIDELRLAGLFTLRLFDFDALEIQLGAMAGLLRLEVVLLPQVAYRFTDAHRIALGARIFDGLNNTLAALYDDNDELFVAYEWSF